MNVLDKLDNLGNLLFTTLVPNRSQLPLWAQGVFPIHIARRIPGKVLLIYIANMDYRWLMEQKYVTSVKMVPEGPSGYHIEIEQA